MGELICIPRPAGWSALHVARMQIASYNHHRSAPFLRALVAFSASKIYSLVRSRLGYLISPTGLRLDLYKESLSPVSRDVLPVPECASPAGVS